MSTQAEFFRLVCKCRSRRDERKRTPGFELVLGFQSGVVSHTVCLYVHEHMCVSACVLHVLESQWGIKSGVQKDKHDFML